MTDTIDTFNDEINGGMSGLANLSKNLSTKSLKEGAKKRAAEFGEGAKKKAAEFGEGAKKKAAEFGEGAKKKAAEFGEGATAAVGKGATAVGEFGKFAYENSDFYVVLFAFNFILRLGLIQKKHVKESFGVTLILTAIFVYMHFTVDKDMLRGKLGGDNKKCIQFTIFTLILFSIFMYDYVNIVLMLVKKKFFSKKNQGILSGIMLTIIVGIFALYYMTIVLAKGMPINPFLSEHFHPFLLGSGFLIFLFSLSILGFFIIYPNIKEIQKSQLSNNNNDRKEFFIDMFKKYYMVFILISCILLVVLHLNEDEFYTFVGTKFPCPKPIEVSE